ncbi:MAG: choline transporter [Firmicutes bacterium HGW-Firmicutes-1]|nr:MAG: choline transporter [Firmicutes bacterium HGW-Firmicutes-1]
MSRNHIVFVFSIIIILFVAFWGIFFPKNLGDKASVAYNLLISRFGWVYLLSVSIFLIFCIYLIFSPYKNIKLGSNDSKPQFSTFSWFAMLFSAGMAVGLIFWGVAEPLSHFVSPPHELAGAGSQEAIMLSLRYSFFHWGLHAWANYALFALAIAYFQLRKGYPGLVSSIFIPLIGEKNARGWMGIMIDLLAIFATVTGIATDLGLGTLQINSGLHMLYNIPENITVQIIIIIVATICFMTSAIRGLEKGIKLLSNINLWLSIILVILAIIVGPKLTIIRNLVGGLFAYGSNIIGDSLPIGYLSSDKEWLGNWTIFYWAWWIAWTPFVGTFIARISWGRTIKEFIMGVLFVPVIGSIIWFCIFGTLGMSQGENIATSALKSIPTAYFTIIEQYPMSGLISFLTVVLLFIFFVTSADSSTFVLGMFSSNGDPNPSTKNKAVWGIVQSLLALGLLLAGGLEVLQTANIVAAFPFAFVMLFAMIALMKSLKEETSVANKISK